MLSPAPWGLHRVNGSPTPYEVIFAAHTHDTRQFRVLVVHVQRIILLALAGHVAGHIVVVVLAQLLVVCDLRVQRLARGEGGPQLRPFLCYFGIAQEECSAVEVVPPLAGLFALERESISI
jgi:hypothetical protein